MILPVLASLWLATTPSESGDDAAWIRRHLARRGEWQLGGFGGLMIISERHDYYALATAPQRNLARLGPEAGLRAAWFPLALLGVETEFSGIWTRVTQADDEPAFLYGLRAHAMLRLPLYRVAPFVLGGYGITGVRSPRTAVGNDVDPAGHYGVGVMLMADDRFAVRFDGRHLLGPANVSRRAVASHFSVTVGISVRLGPAPVRLHERGETAPPVTDGDGDGVRDTADACPALPGPPPHGCPPADADADGVADAFDRCPGRAGETADGCPAIVEDRDLDDDGVSDDADACPDAPGGAPRGCPEIDSDGDGLLDRADRCPWEPGAPPDGCAPPAEVIPAVPDSG